MVGVGEIVDPIRAEMLGIMDILRISHVQTGGIFDKVEAAEIESNLYGVVLDSALRARRLLIEAIFLDDSLEDIESREYHETKPLGFTTYDKDRKTTITLAEWRESYIEKHDKEP